MSDIANHIAQLSMLTLMIGAAILAMLGAVSNRAGATGVMLILAAIAMFIVSAIVAGASHL